MKLLVRHHMSLDEINKSFQKHFPFLKLKCYHADHLTVQRQYTSEKLHFSTRMVKQIQNSLPAVIEFKSTDTIEEFENLLKKELDLPVSVFRKTNECWVDTTPTKYLSLEAQNSLGAVQIHEHYNDYTLFL